MLHRDRTQPSGQRPGHLSHKATWCLAGIVLLGIALRLWGVGFGLPYTYHPDEPKYVQIAQSMFKTGDWNPHFFNFPSLFLYVNALAYFPYLLVGRLGGWLHGLADIAGPSMIAMAVGRTSLPGTFLLGRTLTVVLGSASVGLVFVVARSLTRNTASGLLAAAMMALSPAGVAHSRFITPDTFQVFFVLLAFWGSVRIWQRGRVLHYVWAGVAAGLAASTKYNGAVVLLAVVLAHLLRHGWKGLVEGSLYIALLASAAAFFLTTPFALLDSQAFIKDLLYEAKHYATGHVGMEGNTIDWYLAFLWRVEGPATLLAIVEVARGLRRRLKPTVLLASFPLAFFAFVSRFAVRNDRTVLPILPFLFILAASWVTSWFGRPIDRQSGRWQISFIGVLLVTSLVLSYPGIIKTDFLLSHPDSVVRNERGWLPWMPSLALVALPSLLELLAQRSDKRSPARPAAVLTASTLAAIAVAVPLVQTIRTNVRWTTVDSRETARVWIDQNLPRGARVAVESYAPYVDPVPFWVEGYTRLIQHPPKWYVDRDFEYLVFGQSMFERFYREPDRYARQVSQYDALFQAFAPLKTFSDGGYEVRICRVGDR